MIPAFQVPWEPARWKTLLREAVRTTEQLLAHLELPACSADVDPTFPVRVPAPYLSRMRPGDAADPLLLQVLPQMLENDAMPGYVTDALDEGNALRVPGLLQKYNGRCLLITTPACAVHCRYCFRRHFPYEEHGPANHERALSLIAADPSLEEVILSGGDPLIADDGALGRLLERLDAVPHVRRIRIHTRLPVVIPERVTSALVQALGTLQAKAVMVVHVNHANELDAATQRAFACLAGAGTTLLNQAVLLHGVNDNVDALANLSEGLFEQGVLPYYLHMPDRVTGTHHFDVPQPMAAALMRQLHARLPGYLVPQLVREIPGDQGKRPIYWATEGAEAL